MNKFVYLDMPILDVSKKLMYEFWQNYVKAKYQDKAKLCYMDSDNFVIHIKTDNFYEQIDNYVGNGLTHLTMMRMIKDHLQQVRTKKQLVFLKMNQEETL